MELSTYAIGYQARMKGDKQESNPFPVIGLWHKNWLTGWQHADEELRKKGIRVIPIRLIKP